MDYKRSLLLKALRKLRKKNDSTLDSYEESFDRIYEQNMWGPKGAGSGPGSDLALVLPICVELARFIDREDINSIVDISCGGMAWWPTTLALAENEVHFRGVDVSSKIIHRNKALFRSFPVFSFEHGNALTYDAGKSDLLVCRETINHLARQDALKIVQRMMNMEARFVALSQNSYTVNNPHDEERVSKTGSAFKYTDWNISLPPFNLPEPTYSIPDFKGRTLAIYRL